MRSMILHCADISNQAKPQWTAYHWSMKVLKEFFAQGDAERRLDLPVSPLCDRNATDVPSSQVGFIDFIVRPSFVVLQAAFPAATNFVKETNTNYQAWQARTGATTAK